MILQNSGPRFSLFQGLSISFILLFIILSLSPPVSANPEGGQVVAGQATIQQQPGALTVNQASERAVINWQGFSINSGELTRFVQPSTGSAVLNRVTGALSSQLNGTLEANGLVFLINPNGVVIGPSGRIDTAAFGATTLNTPDSSFMAGGDIFFSGDSTAVVSNLGIISASGGDILLVARQVENSGTLNAPAGTAALAAGNQVLMTRAGDERIVIETGLSLSDTSDTGVDNSGLIEAGRAELKSAGGNIYALAVNNSGAIHATGMVNENGRVLLKSLGSNIENSGAITARNPDGSGGDIRIAAEGQAPSAVLNSGTLDVSGTTTNASGGTVTITADMISLENGTSINASADIGGGSVRIGGDFQGSNPDIHNANQTSVDHDVTISADALAEGSGGEVIVWSDGETSFSGTVSARGGALSGDGGFVEVSGKQGLNYQGLTDTRAQSGTWGTLLLDPETIQISDVYEGDETVGDIRYLDPAIVSMNLAMNNLQLQADTSLLFENGTIEWFTQSTLTLEAGDLISLWGSPVWGTSSIIGTHGALTIRTGNLQQEAAGSIGVATLNLYQTAAPQGSVSLLGTVSAGDLVLEAADITGSGNYCNTFSEITINNSNNSIDTVTFSLDDDPLDDQVPFWARFSNVDIYTQGDLTIDCQQQYDSFGGGLEQPLLRFANPVVLQAEGNITLSAGTRLAMDLGESGLALVAGGNFVNLSDADALTATDGTSRFNIYSTDPRNDTWSGLSGYKHYNTPFDPDSPALGQQAAFAYTLWPTLTLTVNDTDMTYGGFYPNFTVDFDGLIAGDVRNNSTNFSYDTEATATSPVGDYQVSTGATNGPLLSNAEGYNLVYEAGTLTIDPATLTIQPQDFTRTYGQENPTNFQVGFTGFVLDEDESVVTGLSVGTDATQQSDAGQHTISASGAQAANYDIIFVDGTLTVEQAPLVIKADDAVRRIGDPDPDFTISCQGLMAWDQDAEGNPNDGVIENLLFNVEGSPGSDAPSGTYLIMVSATSTNYDITNCAYDDLGALIIKEPYQLIISADDKSRLYGTANPALTLSFDGFEDGDDASVVTGLVLDTTATVNSGIGTYPITISDSGYSLPAYYTVVLMDGSFTIDPALITIQALDDQVTYGSSLPELSATVTGLLMGDTLDTPYEFTLPAGRLEVGTHPISISGGTAANYTISRLDGTLTVTPASLTVSADDAQMIEGQAYPAFTATASGLQYDDTIAVVSGLNLVPVSQITMGGAGLPVTTPAPEGTMFINQSGTLTAQNYAPITFQPGVLTITERQPEVITITVIETDLDTSGSGGNGSGLPFDLTPLPFGVPSEGQGFIQYAAKLFIMKAGLDVSDISEWLKDPANRALMAGELFDLLRAPIKEGTALYNQREVFKTYLEDQVREMKVAIAKDAVARYNAWKAEQQEGSNRLLGLLGGTLETPEVDFLELAAAEHLCEMVSVTALSTLAANTAFMVATSTVAGFGGYIGTYFTAEAGTAAAAYASKLVAAGISSSIAGAATSVVAGAIFAIAGSVTRGLQVAAYDKVEDKYANLVSDAQNFDIDAFCNGDDTDQEQIMNFLFISALS